ncbi:TIGR02391 family protein [Asanoa iriomotensis]|uniref:TIGR02391 family protein n=1 Tax=Asanoa iriomotensis TaxID=234613 RepID=UPI001940B9EB|nr:TIGR02391 family protein [Asanoa iriomotensis]
MATSVVEFHDAFQAFMKLHVFNDSIARGVAPAVFPRDDAGADEIAGATAAVDQAAGRAAAAPGLTGVRFNVQGAGVVDPIAAWHTVTKPKPVLEPDDIVPACHQMTGRLDELIHKAAAEAPPQVGAEAMHPLIWGAASRLWQDSYFRHAVAAAAESLITHVKNRTQRNDVAETPLWQETFSDKAPEPGKPRLRWRGVSTNRDVKSMNDGLRQTQHRYRRRPCGTAAPVPLGARPRS